MPLDDPQFRGLPRHFQHRPRCGASSPTKTAPREIPRHRSRPGTRAGSLGIIPREAAEEIGGSPHADKIDLAKLKAATERIGYPVLARRRTARRAVRQRLGRVGHWGATTQDITDTAAVLQVREALALVDDDLNAICESLAPSSPLPRHADGRPQQSPASRSGHLRLQDGGRSGRAVDRHRARLHELRPRVLVGEFGGAAGTLASLGKRRPRSAGRPLQELGLGQPEIAWHTVRDSFAEVGCFLGLVTGTLGKIATDVKLLMQTEVGEGLRALRPGRGSSSTMPQKRNPIACNYILACTIEWCGRTLPRFSKPWSKITNARPVRGRSNGSRCRKSSCSPRAPCLRRDGRWLTGRRKAHAGQSRPDRRTDHVRSRDDGPRAPHRPPARPRSGLRPLPQVVKTDRPLVDLLAETTKSPSTPAASSSRQWSTRRIISASPARWSTAS